MICLWLEEHFKIKTPINDCLQQLLQCLKMWKTENENIKKLNAFFPFALVGLLSYSNIKKDRNYDFSLINTLICNAHLTNFLMCKQLLFKSCQHNTLFCIKNKYKLSPWSSPEYCQKNDLNPKFRKNLEDWHFCTQDKRKIFVTTFKKYLSRISINQEELKQSIVDILFTVVPISK